MADRIRQIPPLMVLHELKIFLEFLNKKSILKSILAKLNHGKPDFNEWYSKMQAVRGPLWPETELERIKLCLVFLEHCVDSERVDELIEIGFNINRNATGSYDDNTRTFLDQYFTPFYEYIVNTIEGQNVVLYILQKFKKRTEWFNRRELFHDYTSNKRKGEELLNKNLRQYLFDQGIDNPLSEPISPSGKADVVAGLETSELLALEVKIFDPSIGYGKAYFKKGFNQALEYADDYNEPVCYLVVFNVAETELRFEFGQSAYPPHLESNNKRVYIISIHLNPEEKAASKKKDVPFTITKEDLLQGKN